MIEAGGVFDRLVLVPRKPARPIIDTGNYIPVLVGVIDEIEGSLTESEWTSRVLGRTVVKVSQRCRISAGTAP
jgi:hypothetical protein